MQHVTIAIAAMASALVLFMAPVYGLVIYLASFAWYPTYLAISIGTVDFTARRIVILALFAKLFLLTDLPSKFKFILLDKIVIIYFAAQFAAGATTSASLMGLIENRMGQVFDMVLPYFAVRMILRNKRQYLIVLKSIIILAVPLAAIGFYQCMTGHNPAGFLKQYSVWDSALGAFGSVDIPMESRWGFYRADAIFTHPIMYGLYFAMTGTFCIGILGHVKQNKELYWIGLGFMGIGLFSSMSSGPFLAALLSLSFIAFYRWRHYWKIAVIAVVVLCGLVEVMSDRHFYDVLGGFTFNPHTAWYRSRLIDAALFEGGMSGHWLTGYGYNVDPGWGLMIDLKARTDMVNHYLSILSRWGLVAFTLYLTMNIIAIKSLFDAFKKTKLKADRLMIWCLGGTMFGLAGAFVSVSLFGPPTTIYYVILSFCGVMPVIIKSSVVQREPGWVRRTLEKDRLLEAEVPEYVLYQ